MVEALSRCEAPSTSDLAKVHAAPTGCAVWRWRRSGDQLQPPTEGSVRALKGSQARRESIPLEPGDGRLSRAETGGKVSLGDAASSPQLGQRPTCSSLSFNHAREYSGSAIYAGPGSGSSAAHRPSVRGSRDSP